MKIGLWSTTPANNNATPPDGWPEGQAAATVNDCAREMMAAIRTFAANVEYVDLGSTPTYASTTSFNLGSPDTTNFEVGRRIKLFDTTTLYGTINSVSATFVSVRLDSGILSSSLSSVALATIRSSNNSLPEAAFQQQNVIINGALDLWQRATSATSVASNQYVADRFKYIANNSASVNIYRDTNVPTIASTGVKLNSSLTIAVSATDAVIAIGDFSGLRYDIEGYDWRKIAHRPLGLSFQVSTNKSGIYAVSLRSTASSASYVQNFTISAINTWTRFFFAFPDAPSTPYTWDYSTGAGLIVTWALAAGTTWQTTGSEWTASAALATSSQVNFLANAGNTFSIADIRLKGGIADTPIAYRPYAEELALAQRYYETGQSTMYFVAAVALEDCRNTLQFSANKRSPPTVTLSNGALSNVTLASAVNVTVTKFDHRIIATNANTLTTNDGSTWKADAEL